jgi:hypothetical protein
MALPKLEKKLKIILIGYKDSTESEFMWDGRPYIESLSHILLSDVEVKSAKSGARRVSIQGKRPDGDLIGVRKHNRRHSENCQFQMNLK